MNKSEAVSLNFVVFGRIKFTKAENPEAGKWQKCLISRGIAEVLDIPDKNQWNDSDDSSCIFFDIIFVEKLILQSYDRGSFGWIFFYRKAL